MEIGAQMTHVRTADGNMPVYIARPSDWDGWDDTLPGLMLFHGASGLNQQIMEIAQRLAKEGYYVAVPNLYYRSNGPTIKGDRFGEVPDLAMGLPNDQVVLDLQRLMEVLFEDSGVDGDRLGIAGFSMEGRLSYRAACGLADVRAAVSFYGAPNGQQRVPDVLAPAA